MAYKQWQKVIHVNWFEKSGPGCHFAPAGPLLTMFLLEIAHDRPMSYSKQHKWLRAVQ